MATKYGLLRGINFERGEIQPNAAWKSALIMFDMPAYTAASDSGQLGGGGTDRNVSTTLTLAQIIQNTRRNGTTVTLQNATCASPGQGLNASSVETAMYVSQPTISAGNLTFNVTSSDLSTEIDAPTGTDSPIAVMVFFTEA